MSRYPELPPAGKDDGMLLVKLDTELGIQPCKTITLKADLQLSCKDITAIFGPSGASKTTLLRCIAGLEKVAYGQIEFAGDIWQSKQRFLAPHKRQVGYVFQEAYLFPHLTVAENLAYARRRAFQKCDDAYQSEVIQLLQLAPLLSKSVATLSGGEKQRVALGRVLMSRPRILLLDEPVSALDEASKWQVLAGLKVFHRKYQLPMIYVSHQRDEVIELADRVVLLENGHITMTGRPEHLFASLPPAAMKECVLSGQVSEKNTKWQLLRLNCADTHFWLADKGHEEGESLKIRILPRDVSITLSEDNDSSMLNRLSAVIADIETVPGTASVMLTLHVGNNRLFSEITRYSLERLQLREGMNVWAQIKSIAVLSH